MEFHRPFLLYLCGLSNLTYGHLTLETAVAFRPYAVPHEERPTFYQRSRAGPDYTFNFFLLSCPGFDLHSPVTSGFHAPLSWLTARTLHTWLFTHSPSRRADHFPCFCSLCWRFSCALLWVCFVCIGPSGSPHSFFRSWACVSSPLIALVQGLALTRECHTLLSMSGPFG